MRISKSVSLQTQFRIEQALFKGLFFFCRSIPASWVLGVGKGIGTLAWKLKARRKVVLKNLSLAFKEKYGKKETEEIALKCYQHFGREMMRVLILDQEAKKPMESWIDIEGLDLLQNREQKGGILVGGHIGCWEIANFVLPKLGEEVTVFTGTHANKLADKWLNEIRSKAGTITAGAGDDRTELFATAKKSLVAIVGDQSPPKAPIMISFFDRPTDAAQGPALLSLLNKVDFFYFSCLKNGDRMKVRIQKVEFEKAETRKESVKRLTQAYFAVLEGEIRKHPEQYFWMHKRWKHSPDVNYGEIDALF
jgi:Kdo2-lipid IVA lauroyltransferase/acyltransferase